jgi:uncharacterized protein (TIGR02611 family)
MLDGLKKSWRQLKKGKPGERFRRQYYRRKQSSSSTLGKVLFIIIGLALVAAGLFFLPAPGPGTLILLPGAGLLARESLAAARALDWLELRVRRILAIGLRLWESFSPLIKVSVIALALAVLGALAFVAYKFFFAW